MVDVDDCAFQGADAPRHGREGADDFGRGDQHQVGLVIRRGRSGQERHRAAIECRQHDELAGQADEQGLGQRAAAGLVEGQAIGHFGEERTDEPEAGKALKQGPFKQPGLQCDHQADQAGQRAAPEDQDGDHDLTVMPEFLV